MQMSSCGEVVSYLADPGSIYAVTNLVVVLGWASGQNCFRAPEKSWVTCGHVRTIERTTLKGVLFS